MIALRIRGTTRRLTPYNLTSNSRAWVQTCRKIRYAVQPLVYSQRYHGTYFNCLTFHDDLIRLKNLHSSLSVTSRG